MMYENIKETMKEDIHGVYEGRQLEEVFWSVFEGFKGPDHIVSWELVNNHFTIYTP